ncbi:tRNA (guanine(37)-N(1))-methyltransferase-like isoform X2 [Styela clava]
MRFQMFRKKTELLKLACSFAITLNDGDCGLNNPKSAFKKEVDVNTILVPFSSLNKFQKKFKEDILKRRGANLLSAENCEAQKNAKFVVMKQDFNFKSLPEFKQQLLNDLQIESRFYTNKLEIRYDVYKHQEIIGAVLPEGLDSTSGFERVGHIIHVNLLEHQMPYKKLIGQVLLDKHKAITTVVNKSSTIDNTYRNFLMEVIAGEANFVTKIIEYGNIFEFDFSKVFWNSKLQTEHQRIVELIPKESVVFDVFAGVGPFSIPLAKKGCEVYANDLNEESYKWLLHNSKLNKAKLNAFNMDGRKFIKECLGKHLQLSSKTETICVIMNLPALAIEFLDAFTGLVKNINRAEDNKTSSSLPPVTVYCYAFSSAQDLKGDIKERAEQSLSENLPEHSIREVRKVAPGKYMLCLSFEIPFSLLYEQSKNGDTDESECKRIKLS